MGREGENLPLVRAGCLRSLDARRASLSDLGRLHGRSIVVRERKGSALGVPLSRLNSACAARPGKKTSRIAWLNATSDRHPKGGNPLAGFRGAIRRIAE